MSGERATLTAILATIYQRANKLDAASEWYARALELRIKLLGAAHPRVAITRFNYGSLLQQRKRHREAIAQFELVLRSWQRTYKPGNPRLLYAAAGLGDSLAQVGRREDALRVLRPAAQHRSAASADAKFALARLLGRTLEGLTLARAAHKIYVSSKDDAEAKKVARWLRGRGGAR